MSHSTSFEVAYRETPRTGETLAMANVPPTRTPTGSPATPDPDAARLAREILTVLIDDHPTTRSVAVDVLRVVPGLCDLAGLGIHWHHLETDATPPPTWWWSTIMPAVRSNSVYGWADRELITVAGLIVDKARADLDNAAPLDVAGEGRSNRDAPSSGDRWQTERVRPRNSRNVGKVS